MVGWICPRCQRVWSPRVRECEYCNDNFDRVMVTIKQPPKLPLYEEKEKEINYGKDITTTLWN